MGAAIWRRPGYPALIWISLFGFASYALMLAALPAYAARHGTSVGVAGLVTTAMLAATVASQSLVPMAVRRCGIGPVLALGLLALGAATPLYLISDRFGWLVGVSAVRGVGFAVLTVIGATMTARLAPLEQRGESIGVYGLAVGVPNLVSTPVGAALTLAGHFSWVAWLASTPLLAVPAIRPLTRAALRENDAASARQSRGGDHDHRGSRPGMRRSSAVIAALPPSVILLVVTLAGGGLVTFVPIERPEGFLAALALLAFGATSTVARWAAGLVFDRTGSRRQLPLALVTCACGLMIVAAVLDRHQAVADLVLITGAAVCGIGYGAAQNLTLIAAFAQADDDHTASAVWNICFDAGTAIGAWIVGLIAAAGLGLPWAYVGCAVVVSATLPLSISSRTYHR
jgi:MFS family permease